MSVSKLTKALQCCIIFVSDHCVIQDLHTRRTIGLGKESGGLLYLVLQPLPTTEISHKQQLSFDIWHWHFGHPSQSIFSHLTNLDSQSYFVISVLAQYAFCLNNVVCLLLKYYFLYKLF